jgi:hypothetical protein
LHKAELEQCDQEPDCPDPATLPKNDARPRIALPTAGVYAGRDRRLVVAGWRARWACQKAAAADPAITCRALEEIMKG